MCRALDEGGRRCAGHHTTEQHAAARARRREQYRLKHPIRGRGGRPCLGDDAGPPKPRKAKFSLGAAAITPMQDDRSVIAGQLAANRERHASIEAAKASQPVQVGEVERTAVVAAEAAEADALEAYRAVSGSNPNADRRPLAERRDHPLPGADHPDGRGWLAVESKARTRLAVAKRRAAEARTAYEGVMQPQWAAASVTGHHVHTLTGDHASDANTVPFSASGTRP